jgi:hypothetical protein
MDSWIVGTGLVEFPKFKGERHYMIPFTMEKGLPAELRHWQPTVDGMLKGIRTNAEMYLMVDQMEVAAGTPHRRPGVHVDGYWNPAIQAHGDGGHHARRHTPAPRHGPTPGRHISAAPYKELLLLASDVEGCQAFTGKYERDFVADWRGGDCADLDVSNLIRIPMRANRCYVGDVFTLHESLPLMVDAKRTLVRINAPLMQ